MFEWLCDGLEFSCIFQESNNRISNRLHIHACRNSLDSSHCVKFSEAAAQIILSFGWFIVGAAAMIIIFISSGLTQIHWPNVCFSCLQFFPMHSRTHVNELASERASE